MNEYPKILIISANALSETQNNGKTIVSLFNKWPKNKIAHLYFREEEEDRERCEKFFYISDYDALDSILSLKKKKYAITEHSSENDKIDKINSYQPIIRNIYRELKRNASGGNAIQRLRTDTKVGKPITRSINRLIWVRKRWILREIYKWLEDFTPEMIFVQCTSSLLIMQVADNISDKFNIPIALQCLDDFTMPIYDTSIIEYYEVFKYNKVFKSIVQKASAIITISDKMKQEYKERFGGKNYYTYSNAVNRFSESLNIRKEEISFLYTGNLELGRLDILLHLGKALDDLSMENNRRLIIKIYSGTTLTDDQMESINSLNSIEMKGFVSSEEINSVIHDADYLLHVESFFETFRKKTRLSCSTKIGEYLSSNRCIIAIGPEELASIEYLKKNNLAFVICDGKYEVLKEKVSDILEDSGKKNQYIENAYHEYKERFAEEKIENLLHSIVQIALSKNIIK